MPAGEVTNTSQLKTRLRQKGGARACQVSRLCNLHGLRANASSCIAAAAPGRNEAWVGGPTAVCRKDQGAKREAEVYTNEMHPRF